MKRYAATLVLTLVILCSGCIPVKPSYVESTVISGFPVPAEARLVKQSHCRTESWGFHEPSGRAVNFPKYAKYSWRGGPLIKEGKRMSRYLTEIAAKGWITVDQLGSLYTFERNGRFVQGTLFLDNLNLHGEE